MDLSLILGFALNLAIAIGAGAACVAAWRWTARIWQPFGIIVGIGILVRAWAGLGLFVVSYYNLPILGSLHTGDGFWRLAPDARVYFELAASSASGVPIPAGSPSPAFVGVLGLWLRATGLVPASAVLFNLAIYVASCVLVIAAFRPLTGLLAKRAALLTVSVFTFSPVMILLGTQPLKDVFSAFLVVVAAVSLISLLAAPHQSLLRPIALLNLVWLALTIYLMAGIRAYYALFMWGAVAAAFAAKTLTSPRALALRWGSVACIALAVFWLGFKWGAGHYYAPYASLITRTVGVTIPVISSAPAAVPIRPSAPKGVNAVMDTADGLRQGFVRTGGATNLTASDGSGRESSLKAVSIGLAALFIPISGLMKLSVVEFNGGRGFLVVTDLDTLFVDVALLAVVWLVVGAGRPTRRQLPFTCFAVGLGLVSAVLMAYIVTNYGTLFRLRLLATVPLWLVPLVLAHVRSVEPAPEEVTVDPEWASKVVAVAGDLAIHTRGRV